MKTSFLAIAIVSASALPVLAADLPYRKGPPAPYTPPPPIFTWTGFYVGANAGGVFSNSSHAIGSGDPTIVGPGIAAGSIPGSYGTNGSGFIGGGQIGYNYQMGAFVAGLEADFQGTTLGKTSTSTGPLATGTLKSSLDWLGTARGRLGYAVFDHFLLYATGGLAYGQTELRHTLTDAALFGGNTLSGSHTTTSAGWTLGAGGEYAITPNWSVKVEYLYYDLGHSHVLATNAAVPSASSYVREDQKGSIIRAGLNYKF
jgi:outer membrane immunogenic protein